MIEVLSVEVEGSLTALKIKRDTVMASLPPTTALHVITKRTFVLKKKMILHLFVPFGNRQAIWAQKCETIAAVTLAFNS
ncbi:hypothetical protein TNIN_359161 [Trichonephila inaurata madagascariensis]|uniref:Uncharacterized protein n=1 Tax=Trichonephila inaurata madagascariensis TaxID=2747483 RepID=A0A8X6X8P5_9ARAC|nr:hypothetical protein TNIN_359161 [Trichonephila inaurata madagascariensis]